MDEKRCLIGWSLVQEDEHRKDYLKDYCQIFTDPQSAYQQQGTCWLLYYSRKSVSGIRRQQHDCGTEMNGNMVIEKQGSICC